MPIAIYWFRRALRLDDNQGLSVALERYGSIVPVFVLDPAILSRPDTGKARVRFLFQGLAALDASLRERGGRLIIRHGDPIEVLPRLAAECGAKAVYYADEHEPHGMRRDEAVRAALEKQGVLVTTLEDHLLVSPDRLFTKAGSAYTKFTPYKKRWLEEKIPAPLPLPTRIPVPEGISTEPLPKPKANWPQATVRGGEAEARKLLDTFLVEAVKVYDTGREKPAHEGTSRLSAYLRFGMLSPRRFHYELNALREKLPVAERVGVDTVITELCWRDFFAQVLYHFPHAATGSFKAELDTIAWQNDERLFEAWKQGRTGYPIVDAAMRQLQSESWMHNRARMIVASFLTKDLLIDRRWGEKHFMELLVDGDMAANNGGWQWAASTGTDAQPYFRIFNPTSQGEKFDPEGAYVKRWVPELAQVPAKAIHTPWVLSPTERKSLGADAYPIPIVDHGVQREKALALFKAVRK
ncbi:MAG: deoxyribodipyrimidine photo-lyase [Armatimonas sp.]